MYLHFETNRKHMNQTVACSNEYITLKEEQKFSHYKITACARQKHSQKLI